MRLIYQQPSRGGRIVLGALPFALLITVYAIGSYLRLSENPNDKFLPSLSQMAQSMYDMAFVPDQRSGDYLLSVLGLAAARDLFRDTDQVVQRSAEMRQVIEYADEFPNAFTFSVASYRRPATG